MDKNFFFLIFLGLQLWIMCIVLEVSKNMEKVFLWVFPLLYISVKMCRGLCFSILYIFVYVYIVYCDSSTCFYFLRAYRFKYFLSSTTLLVLHSFYPILLYEHHQINIDKKERERDFFPFISLFS